MASNFALQLFTNSKPAVSISLDFPSMMSLVNRFLNYPQPSYETHTGFWTAHRPYHTHKTHPQPTSYDHFSTLWCSTLYKPNISSSISRTFPELRSSSTTFLGPGSSLMFWGRAGMRRFPMLECLEIFLSMCQHRWLSGSSPILIYPTLSNHTDGWPISQQEETSSLMDEFHSH